jgi:predicted histone-like DNA-binding protein
VTWLPKIINFNFVDFCHDSAKQASLMAFAAPKVHFFNSLILQFFKMSQKYIKTQNNNSYSQAYGKFYAQAVYDTNFIGTEELADFIQRQASVKKSDIKAVLQELGEAMKHFFELGQKVKLDGIGIFKVGFSSIGVTKKEDCTAATITTRRVLFQPESQRVVVGQEKKPDGSIKLKYVNAKTLLKDVVFEETHDNSMNLEPETPEESGDSTGG